jgi:molecular chaperone DnaK (HSP70)
MSKKNIILILLIISLVAGIIITFTVDIYTSQYKDNLISFHEKSSDVYVDTYFKDTFIPQITNQKYAEELKDKASQLTEIIEKEVDPNLVTSNARDKKVDELEAKAIKAKEGINKMIKIIDEIESSIPEQFKSLYNPDEVKKIRSLVSLLPSGNVSGKKFFRLALILILGIAGAIIFINLERKARLSGEIKSKDVA